MLSRLLRLPAQWPHVVMLAIVAGWGLLALVTAPLFDVVYGNSGRGALILAGYVIAFILGSWTVSMAGRRDERRSPRPSPTTMRPPNLQFAYVCAMFMALLGISLRLYDWAVLRNTSINVADIARRKIDVGITANDSPLGLLAAPLTGFCFLPVMLVLLNPKLVGPRARILAFAVALFPPFESVFFQGGSSGVALALILLLSVLATRPVPAKPAVQRKRRHLTVPQQLGITAFGLGGLILGGTIFTARVNLMAGSVSQYLVYAAGSNANIVIPSQLALKLVDIPVLGNIAFGIYWISLYLTSGVYNLMFVLDRGVPYHTGGATQAQLFFRAFDILTGNGSRLPVSDLNPLAGLYQTMFGDVYYDFGVVGGLVQALAMGIIAALVHRARLRGYFAAQIVDPILKTFLFMGVFASSLSSFGLFVLLAALILIGMTALAPRSAARSAYEPRRQAILKPRT